MKNRLFVVFAALMLTMALTGCGVELTNDTVTHEAGQELNIDATAHFSVDEEKAKEFVFETTAVDADKVGEYEVLATYKNKEFTLKVNVVDTTAPMVEFANRVVFTNDLVDTDITGSLEGIYDASEYATKLIRFEYVGNLETMDENAVKDLTDKIPVPCIKEELEAIGTEEVPEEPGIYRSVLEIKDVHGNLRLEEVYVVYDTTGARIEDVADKTVHVVKEDLDKEPELDKSDYTITDNVDGKIKSDDIVCKLELRDKDKHEWLVHVSYKDRAGNESKAEFLIVVKEKSANSKNDKASSSGSASNGSTASSSGSSSGILPDGTIDRETYISPLKQAALDAGVGVVVCVNGEYGVWTGNDGLLNGMDAGLYLYSYLETMGLYPNQVSGGNMGANYTGLFFLAYDIVPLPTMSIVPEGTPGTVPEGVPDDVFWVN